MNAVIFPSNCQSQSTDISNSPKVFPLLPLFSYLSHFLPLSPPLLFISTRRSKSIALLHSPAFCLASIWHECHLSPPIVNANPLTLVGSSLSGSPDTPLSASFSFPPSFPLSYPPTLSYSSSPPDDQNRNYSFVSLPYFLLTTSFSCLPCLPSDVA